MTKKKQAATKPRNRAAKDSIQRKYLVEYLQRKKRGTTIYVEHLCIDEILAWIAKQTTRAKRPGGIGRR